ncbi:uncharacterized protein LOC129596175 [Paramacrobiotus metropolitanus]|uniref:uncharacterized protein LOC129596175 n=1 Tax=Paramacrobiotus metropolitanus TaxID=2943436 RepID=UPI0024464AE6|nr:uncharacterized protein LOC129596175 [Paramacrobiotus metropolitanus]
MCRIGIFHDFHGIGVANLIFGIMYIILPDHALFSDDTQNFVFDDKTVDFFHASDAITIINGIFFLAVGICSMVLARRWMESLKIRVLLQVTLVLAIISVVICPITFILNIFGTYDAAYQDYVISPNADDGSPTTTVDSNAVTASPDTGSTTASSNREQMKIQLSVVLNLFMFASRFLEYRYAICATFVLIAFGAFFMNIALIVIIFKTKNFQPTNFTHTAPEPHLDTVPYATVRSSAINYRNMDDTNVVIQPLPETPGVAPAHTTTPSMNAIPNGINFVH